MGESESSKRHENEREHERVEAHHVFPTGKCFDDALDLLVTLLKEAGPDEGAVLAHRLRLVHAACEAPDGHLYAHAWVENIAEREAYFVGIYRRARHVFVAPTEEYHREIHLRSLIRYSYAEAFVLNRIHNHFGPWVPHLRELCGRPSLTCPYCQKTSYNKNDIEQRYCGNCHRFIE